GALVLASVLRLAGHLDRSATLLDGRLNVDVLVVVTRSLPNVRGELAVGKIGQRDDDLVAIAHHLRTRRLRDELAVLGDAVRASARSADKRGARPHPDA